MNMDKLAPWTPIETNMGMLVRTGLTTAEIITPLASGEDRRGEEYLALCHVTHVSAMPGGHSLKVPYLHVTLLTICGHVDCGMGIAEVCLN